MVIKLNNRIQAGAYRWLGGKHYWILDTKTGIKYKGLNQKNFETVSRLIKNTHDMDRLMSKMSHYTYQGRLEGIQRMADSLAGLMAFRFGDNSVLTKRFKNAVKEMAMKDPDLWNKFVERNNEWFSEYWEYYGEGNYDPYPSDKDGNMSKEKKKINSEIKKESRKTMEAIINAMEQTTATGKVKVITHDFKDYRTMSVNNRE